MHFDLPEIPFLTLDFQLSAKQNCRLPAQKGSMLRGAFGHALRSTVCVMQPNQACKTCMLRGQCIFTRIFDIYIAGQPPPFLKGLSEAPKPFIIDAHDLTSEFAAGDGFRFSFILFGRACEYYPYIIFAVAKMAENGLAAQRLPFTCDAAFWTKQKDGISEQRSLYDGKSQRLSEAAMPTILQNGAVLQAPLKLKFLSPTRLKIKGRYTMDFTFRQLVFIMLRRTLELAHFHVPDAPVNWEFHDFLVQANDVTINERSLRWEDWHRYSNRQQTKMEMGGFVGELTLEGAVEAFSDLLRLSEVVHVGKGTSFGLGKVEILTKNGKEDTNGH